MGRSKSSSHALKRDALLIDLPDSDRRAGGILLKIEKKPELSHSDPTRLLPPQPVDFEVLAIDRVFDAARSVQRVPGVGVASIERCQLGFQPLAGRIGRTGRAPQRCARQRQQSRQSPQTYRDKPLMALGTLG